MNKIQTYLNRVPRKIFYPIFILFLITLIFYIWPNEPYSSRVGRDIRRMTKKKDIPGLRRYIDRGGIEAMRGSSALVDMGERGLDIVIEELKEGNSFCLIGIKTAYEYSTRARELRPLVKKKIPEIVDASIQYFAQDGGTREVAIGFFVLVEDHEVISQMQKIIDDPKQNATVKETAQDIINRIRKKTKKEEDI